jgi:hypothetical protein
MGIERAFGLCVKGLISARPVGLAFDSKKTK